MTRWTFVNATFSESSIPPGRARGVVGKRMYLITVLILLAQIMVVALMGQVLGALLEVVHLWVP